MGFWICRGLNFSLTFILKSGTLRGGGIDMLMYKQLDEMEAMFVGTADWVCSRCSTRHACSDYHCVCGEVKPDGREHIPALLAEVRRLKKGLNSVRQNRQKTLSRYPAGTLL